MPETVSTDDKGLLPVKRERRYTSTLVEHGGVQQRNLVAINYSQQNSSSQLRSRLQSRLGRSIQVLCSMTTMLILAVYETFQLCVQVRRMDLIWFSIYPAAITVQLRYLICRKRMMDFIQSFRQLERQPLILQYPARYSWSRPFCNISSSPSCAERPSWPETTGSNCKSINCGSNTKTSAP